MAIMAGRVMVMAMSMVVMVEVTVVMIGMRQGMKSQVVAAVMMRVIDLDVQLKRYGRYWRVGSKQKVREHAGWWCPGGV